MCPFFLSLFVACAEAGGLHLNYSYKIHVRDKNLHSSVYTLNKLGGLFMNKCARLYIAHACLEK